MTLVRPQAEFNRDVFIVRRWRKSGDRFWRGQIIHVQSGETIAFGSDEELVAYIRDHLTAQASKGGRPGLK